MSAIRRHHSVLLPAPLPAPLRAPVTTPVPTPARTTGTDARRPAILKAVNAVRQPLEALEPRVVLSAGLYESGIEYAAGQFDPVMMTTAGSAGSVNAPYSDRLGLGYTLPSGAAVFQTPQSVAAYQTEFSVNLKGGTTTGVAFVARSAAGATTPPATTGTGIAGYEGLPGNSLAVCLTTDGTSPGQVRLGVDGVWVDTRALPPGIDLRGRPVSARLLDNGAVLTVTLSDLTSVTSGSPKTATVSFTRSTAAVAGPTAFVGFTGAAAADVVSWNFSSAPPTAAPVGNGSGSLDVNGGDTFTLTGSGTGFSQTAPDSFYALTRAVRATDATLEADVPTSGSARGLVLLSSVNASVYVENGAARFAYRTLASDPAPVVVTGPVVAESGGLVRLKLVRRDLVVSGYVRLGGKWQLVGTAPILGTTGARTLPDVRMGLAVWSGGPDAVPGRFLCVTLSEDAMIGADTGAAGTSSRELTGLWVDVIKQADPFLTPDKGRLANIDADGFPTEDFRTRVMTPLNNSLGTYKLSLKTGPNATPKLEVLNATVGATTFDPGTGVFTADVNYTFAGRDADIILTGLDGGARDLHMIRPGYDPANPPAITREYAAYLSNLGVRALRTMNLTETNFNPSRSWADRTLPTDATQLGTRPLYRMDGSAADPSRRSGVAWEHVVELANTARTDLWINIPAQADDDYIRQLATLLKNGSTVGGKFYPGLDKDLNVYIEYSNEVWNPGFDAYHWAENHARAEIAAGDASGTPSPIDFDQLDRTASGTPSVWALRWYARRLAETSTLFASVFGADSVNTRVRTVLSNRPFKGQYEDMLNFVDRFIAPPASVFYGLGTIPYMNLHGPNNQPNLWNGGNDNPNLTADQVLDTLALNNEALTSQHVQFRDIASRFGIKMVAYESGFDTSGRFAQDQRGNAQRDPRIADILQSYTQNWFAHGGDLLMYFAADVGSYGSPSGDYELTERVHDLSGPKPTGFRTATDQDRTAPAPYEPTELRAAPTTETAAAVSWKAPAAGGTPALFELDLATTADFTQNLVTTRTPAAPTASQSAALTDLQPGTTYYLRVRAVSTAGSSAPSAYWIVTTPGTPVAPTAPASASVTVNSSSQLTVSFANSSTTETAFRIDVATDPGFGVVFKSVTVAAGARGDPTSAQVYGLNSATPYYVRVRAENAAGVSPWVAAGSAATAPLVPLAAYAFEEPDASTAILDSAASPTNGTLVGGTRVSGFSGRAIQLDGATSYIDLAKPQKLNLAGQFSVTAWVKPASVTTKADIAIQDWDGTNTPWYLRLEDANTVVFGSYHFRWYGSPADEARATLPYTLTDGRWHHLAGTFDGEKYTLYVDGKNVAEVANPYGVSRGIQPVNLGRNANNGGGSRNFYNGALDEVKFFSAGLGPADVAALARGSAPDTANPTAPTVVVDNAAAAFTGTGRWWPSTSPAGYLGSNYFNNGNLNQGTTAGAYRLSVPAAGTYAVFARWAPGASASRAGQVPYDITTASGTATVLVDQTRDGSGWKLLGTFALDPATAAVTVRTAGTSGLVTTDAVGFAPSTATPGTNPDPAPTPTPPPTPPPPTSTPTGPAGFTYAAAENQTYTFTSPTDLAYGANGKFNYKSNFTGTIKFDNATFGDPIPGVGKYGFYKPASAPTPPAAPTNLTVSSVTTTQVVLTWTDAATTETGYLLQRTTDNATWSTVASLAANTTAYSDTTVAASTAYTYRLAATNVAGPSAYAAVTATTPAPTPPPPPPPTGPQGPAGYTYTVGENKSYTFSTPVDLAYGANGKFNFKTNFTGTITFNNATFGDPLPGTYKSGFYKPAAPTPPPPPPPPPTPTAPTTLVDTRSPAFTGTGRWWSSTNSPNLVGPDYLNNGSTLQGTTSGGFALASVLPARKTYSLFVRYISASNSSASVPIDIMTATGLLTVRIDQRTGGGTWLSLGAYDLDPATASVTIRTNNTSGLITLDALGLA